MLPVTGPSSETAEKLFVEHIPSIDRILGVIARRNALDDADAAEFEGWAKARLIADDYGIIRKFGGRSSLPTFLSVVLSNLYRDYRNSVWGRWRPSAAAQRLGPIGVRLEELLSRDNCPLQVAIGVLRSREPSLSHRDLVRMAAQLPNRPRDEDVPLVEASDAVSSSRTEQILSAEERELIGAVIARVMAKLPVEDAVVMKMRFWNDMSVADIARCLQLEQKPIYPRIESIKRRLKEALLAEGVTEERVRDLLSES